MTGRATGLAASRGRRWGVRGSIDKACRLLAVHCRLCAKLGPCVKLSLPHVDVTVNRWQNTPVRVSPLQQSTQVRDIVVRRLLRAYSVGILLCSECRLSRGHEKPLTPRWVSLAGRLITSIGFLTQVFTISFPTIAPATSLQLSCKPLIADDGSKSSLSLNKPAWI